MALSKKKKEKQKERNNHTRGQREREARREVHNCTGYLRYLRKETNEKIPLKGVKTGEIELALAI